MAQPFDAELEELVSKFSRELAGEIRALILRRLGIGPERAPAPRPAPRGSHARSAAPPPSAPGSARTKRTPARASQSRAPVS